MSHVFNQSSFILLYMFVSMIFICEQSIKCQEHKNVGHVSFGAQIMRQTQHVKAFLSNEE